MEKRQTVLIVHNYYQIPGGEDTAVTNEQKLLENNGHAVVLYTRNNAELKKLSKLQFMMLPFTTIFSLKTYRDIKDIIREQHIDVVHVHNTLNLVSPSVYYAALACKVPVVQTVHNFRLLCPGAVLYRDGYICEDCIKKGLMCAVRHNCYRNSKLQTLACVISTKIHRVLGIYGKLNYICLTEFNKRKLLLLKQVRPEKVFVKPNFVDTHEPIIPYEQRDDQYVFAGRIDKLKGMEVLLKAWKLMSRTAPRLVICGAGPMEDWCSKFIADNGLVNVKLKGFMSNAKAKKLIANSKALVLPTQWYEGFPMTVAEAYSVGTPVIGSNMGNVGSLIVNGVSGYLFEYNSSQSLANTVQICQKEYSGLPGEYTVKYNAINNYRILSKIYQEAEKET